MKQMVLWLLLVGLAPMVNAQSTKESRSSKTKTAAAKGQKTVKNKKADTVQLSNRNIYQWSNGQRSTPTGKEATSSNGSEYATVAKDTGKLVRKDKKKH